MENIGSYVIGGGTSGIVFGAIYLLYKYLNNHRINCVSGCCKIILEEDRSPVHTSVKHPIEKNPSEGKFEIKVDSQPKT